MPYYATIMIIFLLFFSLVLSFCLERTVFTPPVIFGFSLLLPILIFSYRLQVLTYLTLGSAVFAFCAGYYPWILSNRKSHNTHRVAWDSIRFETQGDRYYKVTILVLFFAAQVGFLTNLMRVISTYGSTAYFIVNSKDIELSFGKSSFINYIYFLNIYVAALCTYYVTRVRRHFFLYLILFTSILELLFIGIKSTFIFGSMICFFVYILAKRSMKSMILPSLALLISVGFLFAIVNLSLLSNGTGEDSTRFVTLIYEAIENYIYYNYINLDLEIAKRSVYTWGEYTFFFISKIYNPGMVGYYDSLDFILLDPDYNMGTLLREYFVDFGIVGALLIPFMLGNISAYVILRLRTTFSQKHFIFAAVLMTASAFAFFGNQFVRLQFIYIVMVAYSVDVFARLSRSQKVL